MAAPYFSVVVPVFDEEGNVYELYRRLKETMAALNKTYEFIFVDDGSRDSSFAKLEELHRQDPQVRALRFSRNFGHHIAITAGMDAARGEVIVLMDADLEDRPEAIVDMHRTMLEGYDVVYGVRQQRTHSLFKRLASILFVRFMNSIMSEGHAINTSIFRLAKRPVVDAVKSCREQYRFILGLFSWVGFRQIGVDVTHGSRFSGKSKYSLWKMLRLALVTVTAFSRLPLRVASFMGLAASGVAFVFGAYLVFRKLYNDTMIEGWTSTLVVILFVGGAQLLCLGVLGEYLGHVYGQVQSRPLYIIATELGNAKDTGA